MSRARSGFCWNPTTTLPDKFCPWTAASLYRLVSDAVDFHFHFRLVEFGFHRGARRTRFAEEFRVDFVHRREILATRQEHGALHHVGRVGSGQFENAADVTEN